MEIELYSKLQNPIEAIDRMGEWIARSGMFGCSRVEQGKVIALTCVTERITPIQFNRTYDVMTDGKIRKKALAALAAFRRAGGKHRWLNTGDDGQKAVAEFAFEGNTVTVEYSIEDAQRAELVKPRSGWTKNPGNMLRARVISNGIAMLAPEIYAGEEDEETAGEVGPGASLQLGGTDRTDRTDGQVVEVKTDEQVEAEMGLAPVTKAEDSQSTIAKSQEQPAKAQPVKEAPKVIKPKAFARGPAYDAPKGQLTAEKVEELGQVLSGHFLPAAKWLAKEGWLPKPDKELTDEAQAGAYLESKLSGLASARAQRILKQRESFLRAIKEAK